MLSSPKSCTSASWAQAEQETKIDCLFQSSSQSHGITSTPTKLWSLSTIYLSLKIIVHQFQLYVQKLKKTKTSLIRVGFNHVNPAFWYKYLLIYKTSNCRCFSFTLRPWSFLKVGRSKSNIITTKTWSYQQAYQYAVMTWINSTLAWGLILQIVPGNIGLGS